MDRMTETRTTMNQLRYRTLRRHLRRRKGMTLVEIMIVVIIMALIATAVGFAVLPRLQEARIRSTHTDAVTVRGAAVNYMAERRQCPTMSDLVDDGFIDRSNRTTDAWDHEFTVECEGSDVRVLSAGPDEQMGNEDDISS